MSLLRDYSPFEIDEVFKEKEKYEVSFTDALSELQLDAIITPVYPHCAFKIEDVEELGFIADYLSLQNVLDMPAGIIPITKVLEEETNPEDYADRYNDVITKKMRNSIKDS